MEAGFPEIIGAEEAAQFLTFVVEAAFKAHLFAARIFGKFQIPGLGAIGVEHLVAVEVAVAGDGGEAPGVAELGVHAQVHVIHVARQAGLIGAEHGGAER